MFKIGDYIVYGSTGVCRIENISTESVAGNMPTEYYIMTPVFSKSTTVKTPVTNTKVIMRNTIDEAGAQNIMESAKTLEVKWEDNYRVRNEVFREAAHSCNCEKWLWLMKAIHKKSCELEKTGKKLRQTDEMFLGNAEKLLCGELAMVLKREYDDIKNTLYSNFESHCG